MRAHASKRLVKFVLDKSWSTCYAKCFLTNAGRYRMRSNLSSVLNMRAIYA
jgi:hypothetical protein